MANDAVHVRQDEERPVKCISDREVRRAEGEREESFLSGAFLPTQGHFLTPSPLQSFHSTQSNGPKNDDEKRVSKKREKKKEKQIELIKVFSV